MRVRPTGDLCLYFARPRGIVGHGHLGDQGRRRADALFLSVTTTSHLDSLNRNRRVLAQESVESSAARLFFDEDALRGSFRPFLKDEVGESHHGGLPTVDVQ